MSRWIVAGMLVAACSGSSSGPDAAVDSGTHVFQFAPAVAYASGAAQANPTTVRLAHINGDTSPDLVVTNNMSEQIAILINDGHGVFGAPIENATDTFPDVGVVGDFDGDGDDDVIETDAVYLNQSNNGSLAAARTLGTIGIGMDAGDFDGDTVLDIAACQPGNNALHIARGAGNGIFFPPVSYMIGDFPNKLLATDVNGDHRPDIIVSSTGMNNTSTTVSVWLMGADAVPGVKHDIDTGVTALNTIAAADLDRNGTTDLVVTSLDSTGTAVLSGAGDGTFTAMPPVFTQTGGACFGAALGDLDGDGAPDLALACGGNNTVQVFLNKGDGTFASPLSLDVGIDPVDVQIGDLDGDGRPDLVTSNFHDASVSVLLQQ